MSDLEFFQVAVPWTQRTKDGIEIDVVPNHKGEVRAEDFVPHITPRTRVITLSLNTFTNVTNTPGLRVQLNFKTNWEIVNNFNFSFSILESYDSNPPTEDAAENDLSLVTSIGYSF
jgi:hypothetical protein